MAGGFGRFARAAAGMAGGAALVGAPQLAFCGGFADEQLLVQNALRPGDWVKFKVSEVETVSHDSKRLRLALPERNMELGLPTAACLIARGEVEGETVARKYTPISKEDAKGYFDLVVKGYEKGKLSKFLVERQVGDEVEFKGPIAKMEITRNMKKAIGMIAGGTGIAPMLQVIDKLLSDPRDDTEIRLLFANKSEADILLRNRLDALSLIHPRFKVYYTIEEAGEGWTGYTGRATAEMLAETMPPPSDDHLIMICGPRPMLGAISGTKGKGPKRQGELGGFLKDMGYSQDQVFKF